MTDIYYLPTATRC